MALPKEHRTRRTAMDFVLSYSPFIVPLFVTKKDNFSSLWNRILLTKNSTKCGFKARNG